VFTWFNYQSSGYRRPGKYFLTSTGFSEDYIKKKISLPKNLTGSLWEYALLGKVHIAVGRNNDIGGNTLSKIHKNVLMTKPTVKLEGEKILENEKLLT